MKASHVAIAVAVCFGAACTRETLHDPDVDSSIASELRQTRAIDNHAHPMAVSNAGEEDHDYDALSMEGIQDMALPSPFRPDSPYFAEAWHALYGADEKAAHPNESHVEQLIRDMQKRKGDLYP